MPYSKVEGHSECEEGQIAVVKDSDGSVQGCHDNERAADDQIAAIEASEDQSVETEITLNTSGPTIITKKTSDPNGAVPTELRTLRSRAQSGERVSAQFQSRQTTNLDTTESRLETINRLHSDRELGADDVEIFRDYAVHDLGPQEGMRRPLQFTTGALQKLASDFQQGRTMNVHHNGERQVGATFGATIERNMEVRGVEANWLAVDFYTPTLNASEQRMQDITDLQTGVLRYTSIEFAGGNWEERQLNDQFFFEVDANGEDAFAERLEAEGIARVSLGAVRGAGSS